MLSTTRQRLDFAFPGERWDLWGHPILACACGRPVLRMPDGQRRHAVSVSEGPDGLTADLSRDLEPCPWNKESRE